MRTLKTLIISGSLLTAAALTGSSRLLSPTPILPNDERPKHSWSKRVNGIFNFFQSIHPAKAETLIEEHPQKWNWNWDGRHSGNIADHTDNFYDNNGDALSKPQPRFSRHLLLIRHGQYVNAESDDKCVLTPLGREQLRYTAERLNELNHSYNIVNYSTMTRAIESAEQLASVLPRHLKFKPTDDLREGAPCELDPPLDYYRPSPEKFRIDGQRIEEAFNKYVHRADVNQTKDSYEVFVCHANVIRYFVCRALQFPPQAWIRMSLDHGSITWLTIRPDGRVTLRWLGNSGHMPPSKITIA